jgi:hypothetical protein
MRAIHFLLQSERSKATYFPGRIPTAFCNSCNSISNISDAWRFLDVSGFRYYGDRWQSSPDGIKSHDFTYFYPLAFTVDGNVTDMKLVDSFEIDI